MLEPRRRIDRALGAVVMEAYVAGVSTRSVDDLVAAQRSRGYRSRRCRASVRGSTRWWSRSGAGASRRVPLRLCGRDLSQGAQQRLTGRLDGDGRGHRCHRRRQPGDPGMRHRRQRERGVLAALVGLAAVPRARRGAPGEPTPTPGSPPPRTAPSRAPGASDAGCTSSAALWRWCPAPTSTWPPQCSGPCSRSPTPTP